MECYKKLAVKNRGKHNEVVDPFDSINTRNSRLPPISPCIRVRSTRVNRRKFAKAMQPIITRPPFLSNLKQDILDESFTFCSKKPSTPYFLFSKEDIKKGI